MLNLPRVVISIDFEMGWGIHDIPGLSLGRCRQILDQQSIIVTCLTRLLAERNLRATWACVSALACKNWQDYFTRAPLPPQYYNKSLGFKYIYAERDPDGKMYFAPDLLRLIHSSPGQELGTHTFSHIYMREPGITAHDVKADIIAACVLWQECFGTYPRSLAFPRNQQGFVYVFNSSPIKIWRGNEDAWYYNCHPSRDRHMFTRSLRLLDSINPLLRRSAKLEKHMTRSSLYLRINLPDELWRLHLVRIKNELKRILPQEIFHIWFHPHDIRTSLHLRRVTQVLDIIAEYCHQNLLISANMVDLTDVTSCITNH